MSDGYPLCEDLPPLDVADCDREPEAYAHASRPARHRPQQPFASNELLSWLPRLGPVLWLQHRQAGLDKLPTRHSGSTLLLDHPAITALANCKVIRAHQRVTPQGPREWLSFHSSDGSAGAKLFLLPDSDVLAWDQMCLATHLTETEPPNTEPPSHASFLRRALDHFGHRWRAHLLEFSFKQRPWLSVLGAQPPLRISLLGLDIVRVIARDENAEWASPLQLP
ncbi:MAG TPA: hypothetical protein VFN25_07320 [Dokdonella sp.]|uniref:hypothetical protein n=1 Tax=Dokdonella sp. TaxID=2291710 RepID=UPI002D800843|nr:hypothetical protein [Dokdonella sp.]HET9032700.1 hypothetical protein [Dokdonella sp.]